MKKIFTFFSSVHPSIIIIAVAVLAFGLQIPWLGFYQDDWQFVFYAANGASGLRDLMSHTGRPFATFFYIPAFSILGFQPQSWHIFELALRSATVLVFWRIFESLWPKRRLANLSASLLFLIYPFFTLQPLAVAYSQHWTGFLFYAISIWAMIYSTKNQKYYFRWTFFGILATFLHLYTIEYFIGLEVARPLILWLSINSEQSLRKKVLRWIKLWFPYLLVGIWFVFWRTFILSKLNVPNNISENLLNSDVLQSTAANIGADLALFLFYAWSFLVKPSNFVFSGLAKPLVIVLSIISIFFLYKYLNGRKEYTEETLAFREPIIVGIVLCLGGLVATYAAGFSIHLKVEPWNSRLALAALPGAALVITSILEYFIKSTHKRQLILAILVGLSIGWHNHSTLTYKASWEKQVSLYQQLKIRAPKIEPGTSLITNQEILPYMGDYPSSYAISTIYDPQTLTAELWFFPYPNEFFGKIEEFTPDTPVETNSLFTEFNANTSKTLVLVFEPEANQCLWILRPLDGQYSRLPDNLKDISENSHTNLISDNSSGSNILINTIIGSHFTEGWCNFYQKADLARQYQQWEKIPDLWEQAQKRGFRPDNGFEYIPFIEGYAHTNNWDTATSLTKSANRVSRGMTTILCPVWKQLAENTEISTEQQDAYHEAINYLSCTP